MKALTFVALCFLASCATTPPPELDLATKGVVRVGITVTDFDSRITQKPTKLYFALLTAQGEYKSEKIVTTERVDPDGRLYINLTPGIYGVVACERYFNSGDGRGMNRVYTLFNNDLISRMTVQVEAGRTQVLTVRILEMFDTLLDKTPDSVKYYRRVIDMKDAISVMTIGKFIDSPEAVKKRLEEKKETEKVKLKIESY